MTSATMSIERGAVATSFTDLRLAPQTLSALARMEITTPTPIQARALPALLAGRDVIGQARTGSGKTLAFGIPAIEGIDPRARGVQVLILVPTRELAVQVGGVLDALAAGRRIRTVLIFGGRAAGPQITALRAGAQIVVGTPGRVLDLLDQRALDLSGVRFLVLDEADEMLDRGFAPSVEKILARSPRPGERQTALFSATVPGWVNDTAGKHLREPVLVKVDPRPDEVGTIEHVAYELGPLDKVDALRELLDRRGEGQIIVFGRTKHGVKKLARRLETDGYPVAALQGNLSQNARDRVMEDFRSGRTQILLATNVAARGLDISTVDHVINVELPESPELLTHRIGRTGRMGRDGQAITLLGPEDGAKWRQLERGLAKRIPRVTWPGAEAVMRGGTAAGAPSAPLARAPRPTAPAPTPEPAPARDLHALRPADSRVDTRVSRAAAALPGATDSHRDGERRRGGRARARGHQIVCSGCGQQAEVPFQPDPARPVYCSACFQPRSAPRRRAQA